ncbi:MAG: hypothetical protein NTX03_08560 [Bacteroidetes bacterium]|nr:hypothetical protein [Bacteroidota bacterium]
MIKSNQEKIRSGEPHLSTHPNALKKIRGNRDISYIKTILSILLFLITSNGYSQNLSLDEVISLKKKNLAELEEYLSSRNWNYQSGSEPTSEKMGEAHFTFHKSYYDDKAESFITYYYDEGVYRVGIQVASKEKYNNYLARIKSYGCTLIKSEIKDGDVIKIYKGLTTTIKITITTQLNNFGSTETTYYFFIVSNDDYINSFSYEW